MNNKKKKTEKNIKIKIIIKNQKNKINNNKECNIKMNKKEITIQKIYHL